MSTKTAKPGTVSTEVEDSSIANQVFHGNNTHTVVKNGNMPNIAPSLKTAAESLEHNLQHRPSPAELMQSSILKPFALTLASSLQLDASRLENAMAHEVSEHYLQELGAICRSYSLPDVDDSHLSLDIASGQLLRHLIKRPNASSVPYRNSSIADSLQPTAKKLELQKKRDSLSKQLKHRPTESEVKESGILFNVSAVAPSLQQTIRELGKELIKDSLNKVLRQHRMHRKNSPEEQLFDEQKLDRSLQRVAKRLALHQKRDSLKSKLQARPDVQYLISNKILKPYSRSLATSLQLDADMLEQQLAMRVSREYLLKIGILNESAVDESSIEITTDTLRIRCDHLLQHLKQKMQNSPSSPPVSSAVQMAPSLYAHAKQLEHNQRRDSLSQKLVHRPDAQQLVNSHILLPYALKLANSLQVDASALEVALAHRVSDKTLLELGILKSTVVSIQSIAPEIVDESVLSLDEASALLLKELMHRPSENLLQHRNSGIADCLQSTANKLQTQLTKDSLNKNLKARPSIVEVKKAGIIDGSNAAPSLQQTILQLSRELVKDALAQSLRVRPSEQELFQMHILKGNAGEESSLLQIIDGLLEMIDAV